MESTNIVAVNLPNILTIGFIIVFWTVIIGVGWQAIQNATGS